MNINLENRTRLVHVHFLNTVLLARRRFFLSTEETAILIHFQGLQNLTIMAKIPPSFFVTNYITVQTILMVDNTSGL